MNSTAFKEKNPDLSFVPHIGATSCSGIAKNSGSNFVTVFGLVHEEQQQALTHVYAFSRIADDCVDEVDSPHDQQQALDYWQAELQALYSNQSIHPVMQELKTTIERYNIPQKYFLGIIEGCRMDITKNRYNDYEELMSYCYHVASLVGLICIKIFGYTSPNAEDMAVSLGKAFQLTNILRDVSEDLDRGRIYLPSDLMQKHGYRSQNLKNHNQNQSFKNLMRDLAERAQGFYDQAFSEFENDKENKLKAARAMALIYHRILKKIIKKNFAVFDKRISLSFIEKAWTLLPVILRP